MRRYFVDTIAMVIFSTALGLIVEIAIAGLTFQQSIQTRAAAVPVILLTGRPYGIY
jgi:FixJ family two-component response regulator